MIFNAKKQRLGRLASQVAKLLINGEKVEINNISEIEQTSKNKIYYSHSGYPGGFKKRTYQELGPKKAFEKAQKKGVKIPILFKVPTEIIPYVGTPFWV